MYRNSVDSGVDIWLTRINPLTDEHRHSFQTVLSSEEQKRFVRYIAPSAADQFLVARALLRLTLSHYWATPPHLWKFETNKYGKPFVTQPAPGCNLAFNISHTHGLVACAVSDTALVGVDVEDLSRELNFMALARHSFSPCEASALEHLTAQHLADRFYTLWTLKESYIKARGMGLSIPLDSFWFSADDLPPRIHFSAQVQDKSEEWHFESIRLDQTHRLAIALQPRGKQAISSRLRWISPDDLCQALQSEGVIS